MRGWQPILFLTIYLSTVCTTAAQNLDLASYDIGAPTLTQLWVDPLHGKDSNSGNSRNTAFKTIAAAWQQIPEAVELTEGYEIDLVSGYYPEGSIPNYWESRWGTAAAPVQLKAVDGDRTAILQGDINAYDLRYFYLLGVSIVPEPAGDAFHCERCDHVLLRNGEFSGGGQNGHARGTGAGAHDLIKVNQSQYFFIEGSDIHGADDNPVDFVAVQYGHVVRSRIHDGNDWCMYVKGGSAYFLIEANRIYDCGTGGFTSGQGTGFEYMVTPWLHYEAYDIKAVNNVIYDQDGAGLGINGGYNILYAYNTLYHVGARSHLIEVVFGSRTCDGDGAACAARLARGGWGPTALGEEGEPIPNRNVYIYNNVVYNPAPFKSQYQQFAIYGPRTPGNGTAIPNPSTTDTNLRIEGNLIWNGDSNFPLGVEGESEGCQSSNANCNALQLVAENTINAVEPSFVDPASSDFRPSSASALLSISSRIVPSFSGGDREATPLAPEGILDNTILRDRAGAARAATAPPGAYALASDAVDPDGGASVGSPTIDAPPTIRSARCTPRSIKKGRKLTCTVTVLDDHSIASVFVMFGNGTKVRMSLARHRYTARYRIPRHYSSRRLAVLIEAKDDAGQTAHKSLSFVNVKR